MAKLWGGRFSKEMDALMARFGDSIGFDRRLYRADVRGSIAWAAALARAGVIGPTERDQIVEGLRRVLEEWESGAFRLHPDDEDIHTAVERRLGELIGPLAGKLHTGRSRNDQSATDVRLYMLEHIATLRQALLDLQQAVTTQAEAHLDAIMPGYTHLQGAQPVLFSHWLLSYFWMFQRDRERLGDVERRTAVSPLGAGALAGCPFPIDREFLARELGFRSVAENSMDAVGDRDHIVEFLAWAAVTQVHLSRLAEDLILWSGPGLAFVELDEAYATGSSIMPQKKNPDSLELLRGKAGRAIGDLVTLLTVLKGLPSTYDKDMQEDKEPLFDAIDTLEMALPVAAGVVATLEIYPERMAAALDDALLTTDLADYLVEKGVPFREGHALVGRVVRRSLELGVPLRDLPLEEYRAVSEHFARDLYAVFDFRRAVERRAVRGSTATGAVKEQLARARELLSARD
jgi:argininosuccinate lyase